MTEDQREELKRRMLLACERDKQYHWLWPATVITPLIHERMIDCEGWDGKGFVYVLTDRGRQRLDEMRSR